MGPKGLVSVASVGAVVALGASTVSFGLAAAAASLTVVGTGGVLAWGRGPPDNFLIDSSKREASACSAADLINSRSLHLIDGMTDEEWADTIRSMASGARKPTRIEASTTSGTHLRVPLGSVVGSSANPFITSLALAATAAMVEAAMGASAMPYTLCSVELRGCRGCAVTLKAPEWCNIS